MLVVNSIYPIGAFKVTCGVGVLAPRFCRYVSNLATVRVLNAYFVDPIPRSMNFESLLGFYLSSSSRTNRLADSGEDLKVLGEALLPLRSGVFRTHRIILYGTLVCVALVLLIGSFCIV